MSQEEARQQQKEPSRAERSLSKDVAKLASATTIAAAISIVATPVVTRLFSPEAFGTAAIFVSIATVIGIIACLRYELAILLPKEHSKAASILLLCFLITILTAAATACGLLLYQLSPIGDSLPFVFWLLPMAVILQGFNAALIRWNARKRAFGVNSIARVSEVSTSSALQVGSGLLTLTSSGALIGGYLGGRTISLAVLIRKNLSEISALRGDRKGTLFELLVRYKKFPLVDSFSAFTNTASTHLPPLLLGFFFSPAAAGFYALGYRLIQLPMATLGNAIAQVFFQRFAENDEPEQRTRLTIEVFERLVIIALLPMALIGLLGQEAFSLLFGSKWSEAGIYAEILSLWGFFWLISSPLSNVFTALERQGLGFGINIIIFSSRLLSLLIGAYFQDARLAITLFSASGAIVFFYMLFRVFSLTEITANHPLRIIAKQSLVVAPLVIIILLCQIADLADIYLLIIACLSVAAYFSLYYKKLTKLSDPTPKPATEN